MKINELCYLATVYILTNDEDSANDTETTRLTRQSMPLVMTPATKTVIGIIAIISIIISASLLYGNSKIKSKFMMPFVYWWLATSTIFCICRIVTAANSDSSMVATRVVSLIIQFVGALWFIQVIRSRIADIDEGAPV